ncbi:DNA polymerase/3'-5' exonuclease PolX [Allorhodopirellula heiligendammensis]|uniref:DNA polymerase beta n=1 Tax=Allorhodopirellula heiligendammensis TaxID=2714739 RepID=A0A5C6C5D6_9BACT|nr:DNA polymerase/3'-5' exonuclease PolX [Allorhodopirellula heiligendammensis]TWU19315.1 DNA polymerase/3'-5' exonuclease PolX [Allorhodopirellula heiligendammensis]
MDNSAIAAVFEELAELLEFRGENPFRIRAYQNGARAIRDLDEPVAQIADDPERDLAALAGIGKTLAEKITVLLETGSLPQLTELRQTVPEIVIAMARIPGLGAKKASKLHAELSVESLDDLAAACHAGKVATIKGFGKKTESTILAGLAIAKAASERIYWAAADDITYELGMYMQGCDGISQLQWAGSYRRGRETVGDLDLLAVAEDRSAAMDYLEAYPGRVSTIARGDTKISIRLAKAFQVDMRLVDAEQFGAALQYFTGSQAHNIHVRKIAKERGLKINEYGVFQIDDETRIAGATEEEVYAAVGLPVIAPELREDRQEFIWAEKDELPELIKLEDIRGDLHMHTSATDGQNTIREMADAAIERGLQYIAITDHSQRVSVARGLSGDQLLEQWKIVSEIQSEYEGRLRILRGIECDILEAGGMDLPDEVLSQADWVLASVHFGQKQSRDQITDRILGAIENPHVDCVAHPTGRLINRREAYEVDMDALMQAARQHGKFLELNANPARLDLNDIHLAAAKRLRIPIVINTDAHHVDGLAVMRFGITQARRGGLTASDVANTLDFEAFEKQLNS